MSLRSSLPTDHVGRKAGRHFLAVLLSMIALTGSLAFPAGVLAYTPHAPIFIDGNASFVPANGVTGGSGTPADPYTIEGWEIDPGESSGITVVNTDAYFIIRGVFVHHANGYFYGLAGIAFSNVTNGAIEDSVLVENDSGITVSASASIMVNANNVSANGNSLDPLSSEGGNGISIDGSTGVTISSNLIADNGGSYPSYGNGNGVIVYESTAVSIEDNTIQGNAADAIALQESSIVVVRLNAISGNGNGVHIGAATDTTVAMNTFTDNGVVLTGITLSHWNSHVIAPDNLINGAPIRYYKDCAGAAVNAVPVGQLIVANCTSFRAENLAIDRTDSAVQLAFVTSALLAGSAISNTKESVRIYKGAGVEIRDNNVTGGLGILADYSEGLTVAGNDLWNGAGIRMFWSRDISVTGNLLAAPPPVYFGNGIHFFQSFNILIDRNEISRAGESLYLQNSDGIVVSCNSLRGRAPEPVPHGEGVRLWGATDVLIVGNTISAQSIGIRIFDYSGNSGVVSHHNNLIGSTYAQSQDYVGSAWDDGYPSGGNHWSDYVGSDVYSGPNQDQPGSDGIGDTPYLIPSMGVDRYPLMTQTTCPPEDKPPSRPVLRAAALTGALLQDVTLSWDLSADDGGGENDVAAYEVWVGAAYEPMPVSYVLLATVTAGTSSFVHLGGGVGDTTNHFYFVRAVDASGQYGDSRDQAAKAAIPLPAGRRLISVPTVQTDWDINIVLQTVPWTKARTFVNPAGQGKNWLSNVRQKPWADLTTLNVRIPLWVDLSAPALWTTAGLVPSSVQLTLVTGWNFVGYPSLVPRAMADVLAGVNYQKVEGFAPNPPHYLQTLQPSDVMAAGNGYWIHVSEDVVLTMAN